MKYSKLRVAFIGGGPTTVAHVKAFSDIGEFDLVGIYNRTFDKAVTIANDFGILNVYQSIKDLYVKSQPDIVVVCVYEIAKLEVLSQCIPYKVPILAEKPLCLNYEDSCYIQRLAYTVGCKIYVSLNRRHYSSTVQALTLLGNTENRVVEVVDQQSIDFARKLGHLDQTLNNWMFANSVHLVDYFSIFTRGALHKIHIEKTLASINDSGVLVAYLEYSSGDVGVYKAFWNRPGPWGCSVSTQNIFIELKPLEQGKYQNDQSRQWFSLNDHLWDVEFKPGFRKQAQEVLSALQGLPNRLVSLEDAMITMTLVHKLYFST